MSPTYLEPVCDAGQVHRDLADLVSRLRRELGRFPARGAAEWHKERPSLHGHLIVPESIDFSLIHSLWGRGGVDVPLPDDPDRAGWGSVENARWAAGYILKAPITGPSGHRYFGTRGDRVPALYADFATYEEAVEAVVRFYGKAPDLELPSGTNGLARISLRWNERMRPKTRAWWAA